jgi:DNA-binding CsgD family transcriptional regulator
MSMISHQDYLDVASSRDVATFKSRLVTFAERLDFPLVNATLVVERPGGPPSIVGLRNTPESFATQPTSADTVKRDPVIRRLKRMRTPFIYDQALYVNKDAGDLWEDQAPHGYRTGISMALHMDGGRHFLMGVDRPDPLPKGGDRLIRLMADLQLLAVFAQETAVRLLMPAPAASAGMPVLTLREQEILQWTRDGKSNFVIGQLLNIALSTVNYHLASAMKKLGVATKHQAAAKADALGLL